MKTNVYRPDRQQLLIANVKADIHEDVESYMKGYDSLPDDWKNVIKNDILDIVDKHFEKIER